MRGRSANGTLGNAGWLAGWAAVLAFGVTPLLAGCAPTARVSLAADALRTAQPAPGTAAAVSVAGVPSVAIALDGDGDGGGDESLRCAATARRVARVLMTDAPARRAPAPELLPPRRSSRILTAPPHGPPRS